MEDSDLLQALLQVPPNLKFVQEQLLSGQYSPQQVTELGRRYAEECWNEDLDSDDDQFYSEDFDYYWRESDAIPGRHSFFLYEVFDLLLKFGMDPNHTVAGDYGIMDYVFHIVNGYVAADTLKLLFDHGGNPHLTFNRSCCNGFRPYYRRPFRFIFRLFWRTCRHNHHEACKYADGISRHSSCPHAGRCF